MRNKFSLLLLAILILIGFTAGFSARATIICHTDDGHGVGCLDSNNPYYCGGSYPSGSCQAMPSNYCPSNNYDTTPPTPNCQTGGVDNCGVCTTCQTNYLLCTGSAYPTRTCTYNDPTNHCASLTGSNCNAGQCASCIASYVLCNSAHTCLYNNPSWHCSAFLDNCSPGASNCSACSGGYSLCSSTHTCVSTRSCNSWETYDACTDTCVSSPLKLGYDSVSGTAVIQSATYPALYIPSTSYVGIGTSAPNDAFSIGTGGVPAPAGVSGTGHNYTSTYLQSDRYALVNYGVLMDFMGTSTPVIGGYLPLSGGTMAGPIHMNGNQIDGVQKLTMTGDFDMGANNITNVTNLSLANGGKLTAPTIDPLYSIKGTNYSTFVSSISGGVKEEYVGKIKINKTNRVLNEYEATINFDNVEEGSDLWVWRQVVDFNPDNVDVLITPYGSMAQVYYLIDGNKLIFRSDRPATVSYRLVGKRFDWRNWPTLSGDQTTPGLKVD